MVSEEVLVLSSQYTEIFNGNSVTRDVDMAMYLVKEPLDVP